MTKKIAIVGSCVSEDWYHFQDVHHRLDAALALNYQPSSLISLTAAPIPIPVDTGENLKKREMASLQMDFDKSFLTKVAAAQPDVLIVELMYDSRSGEDGGVLAVDGSWITSNYILARSPMASRFASARHFNAMDDPEVYFQLFRDAARKLNAFLRSELPHCQVILNRARWAEYYMDETEQLKSYPPWEQNTYFRANRRLDELERIFAEEVKCQPLTVGDIQIFADTQHIWGHSPDHFVKYFYTRFAQNLWNLIEESNE
ncbi:DUF6270 domain-containing protein [Aestuariivirga sp.]|uniref:DUF6270 domain-containing protein n=1 Tax=Aestuariivirga sp. TaxID=2650926 RepID=UPI00301B1A42